MQQILAYETDLLEYGDPFNGNWAIEAMSRRWPRKPRPRWRDRSGWAARVAAVGPGYMVKQALVDKATPRRTCAIETGEITVVGVNAYTELRPVADRRRRRWLPHRRSWGGRDQIAKLQARRAQRDGGVVRRALDERGRRPPRGFCTT